MTTSTATTAAPRVTSLVDLLSRQAERYQHDTAYRFVGEDGQEATLTFGELESRARAIGARLSHDLEPGDRVLLVYPPGLEFIGAFFGCLYAGVIATPATYPKPRRPLARMSRIAEDSGAKVALTTSQTLSAIDFDQQDDAARNLAWLATDELTDDDSDWRPHEAKSDDLAFLQYTSGSTSEPKGVMVSHGNLLANLEAIRVAFGLPPNVGPNSPNVGVFWLPAYHDMGLIGGVLTPLYVGGPSVLMPPTSFLQKPLRWLETIHRFKATISGAPDFAYRLCVERTTEAERDALDLSSWRLAFCGAEPIHAATLTAFAEAFEHAGFRPQSFYPCYGLAESTLLAAGPDSDVPPTIRTFDRTELGKGRATAAIDDRPSQALVGCGQAPLGHELVIVDPDTRRPQPERTMGEILVRGPSVARGYWHRQEASCETFDCEVNASSELQNGSPSEDGYLRTGDLGFIYEGELFVTGRSKDVIILRGRNYYPQDIEQTVEASHDNVLPGAAFSCEIDGSERLVVVHQIDRSCRQDDRPGVVDAIRRAVLAEHEIDPYAVVLIRQTALPVTSSGKVQRSLCRDRYLSGELKTLFEWKLSDNRPTVDAVPDAPALEGLSVEQATEKIEEWMFAWLTERVDLDLSNADRNRPFAEQGLDSLTSVELAGELEDAFGVPLPPIVAWNYPTPAALARYLAEESLGPATDDGSDSAVEIESVEDHTLLDPAPFGESSTSEASDVEALLADIENLSDEEAERLLAEE